MDNPLAVISWGSLIVFTIWLFGGVLFPKLRDWRKRNSRLEEIEDAYDRLRNTRRELIYHIDWAKESEDKTKAKNLEPEIERIDKQLEELRQEFLIIQSGKALPEKSL